MKYNFSLFLLLLVFFSVVAMNNVNKINDYPKSNYYVRVLLANYDLCTDEKKCSFALKSQEGFYLSDGTAESKIFYSQSSKLLLEVKDNYIYINDKKYLKNSVKISPKSGDINFGQYYYEGDFILVLERNKLYLINKIDLEDYVFSVLLSESFPGWPLEVLKVFAIAIRTYVTKRAQDAKIAKRLYHVKNNNSHQTYKGHKIPNCDYQLFRMAVKETKDLILTYKGDIIDPLYDVCCGGIIPANVENRINFKKAPYLARKYPCKYCKNCKVFNWKANYSISELESLLDIKNIKSLIISKKDKAGLVKEVKVKSGNHFIKLTGSKLSKDLKRIKSSCYSLKREGNKIFIDGHGYGHQMGLCQWGARQMVRQNFNYKQILEFYYPGTSLARFPG